MSVNKVNLVGRLGKDPEFHYLDKNTTVTRLRVAVSDYDYDAEGSKGRYTTWITVELWNRLAFVAKNGLAKGSLIAVEGRLVNNVYVDKEGVKRYQLQVEAESIENLSREKRTAPTACPAIEVEEEKSEDKPLSIKDIDKPEKGKKKRKP